MPRIKYYNKNTNQWEYADSKYTVSGGASGESGVLCVTVQGNSHDGYTADKTAEEVYNAYTSGKSVVCNVHDLDGNYAMSLAVVAPGAVLFNCTVLGFLFTLVISDSDNTVELHFTQLVTEDDFSELEEWAESLIDEKLVGTVKSVNGQTPDANGNVQISIPDSEGADVFWVTAAYDPMKNEATCNLTPDEIYRAATGKSVICELNNDGIKIRMVPAAILSHVSVFYTYAPYGTECWLATLVIQENAVQYVETALVTEENIVEAVATVMAQAGVKTESEINEMIDEKLEGFAQDYGGNVDLAITGAEVGQTVRIAEVDKNGVPTAWEAVEFPSGGGCEEKVISIPIEETIIAMGTIPAGVTSIADGLVDTGLTLGDLRKYKCWGYFIRTDTSVYTSLVIGTQKLNYRTDNGVGIIYQWVDNEKTMGLSATYGQGNSTRWGSYTHVSALNYWNGTVGFPFRCTESDDTKVFFGITYMNNVASTPKDITWSIQAYAKYEE